MKSCPLILRDSAWELWIASAPPLELGENVDPYHGAARRWLKELPGHNGAPVSPQAGEALTDWIESYQQDLIRAKSDEPSLGDSGLKIALWSLIGGVAGGSIWSKLAMASYAPASIAVPFCVGLVSASYLAYGVYKASQKARRWRMLNELDMELQSIKQTVADFQRDRP